MREFTQTNTSPGNCHQTAVACLLEVGPEKLPDQVEIESSGRSWHNAIRAYLYRHHSGLMLFDQVRFPLFGALAPTGHHLMVGETVRTPESGILHVVVGYRGREVWDPHPSRAGLTRCTTWEFLAPIEEGWRETWDRVPCVCPACAT